jgi:CubicO group peptidase (beta-lactamase class C family)
LLLGSAALAGELPTAPPSEVGMSRLERLTQFFKADTDAKRLPGAVVMIARRGKVVYYEAFGVRDPATGAPMQKDSIFRIYSMTKPITGVAVLMLVFRDWVAETELSLFHQAAPLPACVPWPGLPDDQ